jgi:hypothetical protein
MMAGGREAVMVGDGRRGTERGQGIDEASGHDISEGHYLSCWEKGKRGSEPHSRDARAWNTRIRNTRIREKANGIQGT